MMCGGGGVRESEVFNTQKREMMENVLDLTITVCGVLEVWILPNYRIK